MMQQEDTDSLQIVPDPDKLERYHRQQLSAMLDGELSPDQARFMLRRLQHDTALAGRWERWQVCGDLLRGQHNALLPSDFAQKVAVAIAGDATPSAAQGRRGSPRLLRWGGGAALAASVAMATLLVGRQAGIEPGQAVPQLAPAVAASGAGPSPAEPAAIAPSPEAASMSLAAAAAATALAAAEAPRRASGSPARTRSQPAADTRSTTRNVAAPQLAAIPVVDPAGPAAAAAPAGPSVLLPAAATDASLLATLPSAGEGLGTDPFQALPMTAASRPWPRAVTGAPGGYAVGFGGTLQGAGAWPRAFEPARPPAAERFGLPAGPAPRLPGATAIGTRPVPAEGDAGQAAAVEPR